MPEVKWVPFRFDGNQYYGDIDTPEKWAEVKAAYDQPGCGGSGDLLDRAKVAYAGTPRVKYGTRQECNGDETLRQFFEKNGMEG